MMTSIFGLLTGYLVCSRLLYLFSIHPSNFLLFYLIRSQLSSLLSPSCKPTTLLPPSTTPQIILFLTSNNIQGWKYLCGSQFYFRYQIWWLWCRGIIGARELAAQRRWTFRPKCWLHSSTSRFLQSKVWLNSSYIYPISLINIFGFKAHHVDT